MKILIVSSFLPHPLFSGGHVRLFNIIRNLSKQHELVLVCEKRSYQTHVDIDALKKYCKDVIVVPRKKQWSTNVIFSTGFSTKPFLVAGHTSEQMTKEIQNLLMKMSFDLIHIETFYVMQNVPDTNLPTVLVEHNIEYLVYKRYVDMAFPLIKPILLIDILKLKKREEKYWRKATKLVAVSEAEKKMMSRSDVVVVPNGVAVEDFPYKKNDFKKGKKTLLFLGDFKWLQNRDSVNFLVEEVWPRLKTQIDAKLWIVGKHMPEGFKNDNEDVFFDDNAPSRTSDIFEKADLLIAPIRVGGGTSFKILEAMASGVPVVTTALGAAGLALESDKDIKIADSPEEIVNAVLSVFASEHVYNSFRSNARKKIEEKYDWKLITKKLESVYESAVK